MLHRDRRQTLEHPVVDHGRIADRYVAREVSPQGAGAELSILVLVEIDLRGGGESFFKDHLAWPVSHLELVDSVRWRIEAIDKFGTYADFHG